MDKVVNLETFYDRMIAQRIPAAGDIGHFNIIRLEDMDVKGKYQPTTYSRRNYYKVSLVSGHSVVHYAGKSFEIRAHALVFTNPMIPYHWETVSAEQTGYVCIFTADFFGEARYIYDYPIFRHPENAVVPLDGHEAIQYGTLFGNLYRELNSDYAFKYDYVKSMLLGILHEAQKKQPIVGNVYRGTTAHERIALLFTDLLERQFPIEWHTQRLRLQTPADFAKHLHLHVNHLNKVLKAMTGKTTSQLIANRIVEEAKLMLTNSGLSIGEIAWCLGFDEPNHFSAFFRSRTGITCSEFRKSQLI